MVAMPRLGTEAAMLLRPLLPDHRSLALEDARLTVDGVTVLVASMLPNNRCPLCDQPSSRVHSRYQRTLADLPWQGLCVRICWRSRKFFCDNPLCPRRIFTERLPDVAKPYSRKTCRVAAVLAALGFACGGEGGSRLAERLAIPTSPDSLLRAIRQAVLPESRTPRVVGVDDWAFRRGRRYGTILCDLEQHRRIDLLPDRSSESLESWLRAHPGVEIVSRDRGDYYIKGATAGAPQAIQIADRWHLLKNLREALVRVVDRHGKQVEAAVREATMQPDTSIATPETIAPADASAVTTTLTRADELKRQRRLRRVERYQRVVKLHAQGVPGREIARQVGLHRGTVRRLLTTGSFPERAHRHYSRHTDPFLDYLRKRWEDGCHNAVQLVAELRQRGFDGSYHMVRRRVASWRSQLSGSSSRKRSDNALLPSVERPSSNQIAWLLFKLPSELTPSEQALAKSVTEHCPPLESVSALTREFRELVRGRQAHALDNWLQRARAANVAVEMRRFAEGLIDDLSAVKAALTFSWSNGQTEGHVNRLKLIKRQMFGRAKFDLLRQRVLGAC